MKIFKKELKDNKKERVSGNTKNEIPKTGVKRMDEKNGGEKGKGKKPKTNKGRRCTFIKTLKTVEETDRCPLPFCRRPNKYSRLQHAPWSLAVGLHLD